MPSNDALTDDKQRAAAVVVGLDDENRKRNKWSTVLVIALVVLVVSLVALAIIFFSYLQGKQKYDKLSEFADVGDGKANLEVLSVDWDALRAINPDVVAWVYVPDTNINYPVVRGTDNEYYLTHDFEGDQGWLANYGAIFMDYRNTIGWTDDAYFIYGHHMNDGSMFADVAAMRDQGFFDSHRTVYLLSPEGNFKLKTFSLIHCAPDDALVQTVFATPEELEAYVQDKINRSEVSVDGIPAAKDISKAFAFGTCDNVSDGRYVLYAFIEETTVKDLVGKVGVSEDEDGGSSVVNDLRQKAEDVRKDSGDSQQAEEAA